MDPSHKAAEPLPPITPGELARRLKGEGVELVDESATAGENKVHAQQEIASIFKLKDDQDFQWFWRQFIEPEYKKAFDALRIPAIRQEGETLETVQARYVALREIRVGMLEREFAHRTLLDPNDPEILRLRQEIDRL